MAIRVAKVDKGGGVHLEVNCDYCNKPLVSTNWWGMDCANKCALKNIPKALIDFFTGRTHANP
jgi:hypothetical protein